MIKEYQHNIFSAPIWGLVLAPQKYCIQDYLDHIFEIQKTEPSQTRSNVGGYQSRDNLHKDPIFKELVEGIGYVMNEISRDMRFKPLEISCMWANINQFTNHNVNHTHSGVLSGIFHLTAPSNCGDLIFFNPATKTESLLFVENEYVVTPTVLSCIIFPSWLEHCVKHNLNNTEPRVSLNFNYEVKHESM